MKPQMQGINQHGLLLKGLLLLVLIGIWSCEKTNKIGLEITPPGERFAYHIDSSTIIKVGTLKQDSLTSERRSRSLLGAMADPVFGKTRAGILTQLRLSSNDVDFGEGAQLDSVVLLLKYLGSYGDTTHLQHITAHEIQQDLYFDSVYYSNINVNPFFSEADPIADFQFLPTPDKDSLIIRLDDKVGEKILFADNSHLENNTTFLDYFKGIYLQASPIDQGGSITYFDLESGNSRMILYYQNSEEDSLRYDVVINTNCTWVNTFDNDYSNSQAGPFINDSLYNSEKIYVQAMAGLRGHAIFEFSDTLKKHADIGISINKAELRIPVANEYATDYKPVPGNIQVFNALEDGTNEFIGDIFLGEDYYGGYYDEKTDSYTFNLAKYIQDLLDPDIDFRVKNTGLFIVVEDSRVSSNQVVLNNNPSGEKMVLEITYTVIN